MMDNLCNGLYKLYFFVEVVHKTSRWVKNKDNIKHTPWASDTPMYVTFPNVHVFLCRSCMRQRAGEEEEEEEGGARDHCPI